MDIFSSTDDQILEPASQKDIACIIHHNSIACLEPRSAPISIERVVLNSLRSSPVPSKHLWARNMQLARHPSVDNLRRLWLTNSDGSSRKHMANRQLVLTPCWRVTECGAKNANAFCHTPTVGNFLGAESSFALFDEFFAHPVSTHCHNFETRIAVR
jgi:hypothetical protein